MPTATKGKSTRKAKVVRKDSASATIHSVADSTGASYRKARRVARNLGLGVGKGARYDALNKRQVAKLVKELTSH